MPKSYQIFSCILFIATLAKSKKLESMEHKLEPLKRLFWQINVFYRASLQSFCIPTFNTSQMVDISFNRGVKNFSCRKMSRANQPLPYKCLQISIDSRQAHRIFSMVKFPVQVLARQFVPTPLEHFKQLFLTSSWTDFVH